MTMIPNRMMWHECNKWVKFKRIIAGIITSPFLIAYYLFVYSIGFVSRLMVYAGGGGWVKWDWKIFQ